MTLTVEPGIYIKEESLGVRIEDDVLVTADGCRNLSEALPRDPDALEEWNRVAHWLHRIGLLSEVDRAALAAYAQAYGRWVQAERAIAKMAEKDQLTGGLMIKTSNGNAIQNPLVGTANKAAADMMRYAAEFGMTPSARSRIAAQPPEEGADPADRFFA